MKILLILAMIQLLPSCGKRTSKQCQSRESMVIKCQAVNTPAYGTYYAREICSREYSANKCY